MIVRIDYPEPSVRLDLWGGVSGAFAGLDQFNRIIDQRWQNQVASTSTDIDRYQYGYDQNSNRTYKANVVGTPIITGGLDEFYAYDPLNRLTEMQRGVLNGTKTGITGTPSVEQDWTLDPTGNWSSFITKTSGTTGLNQSRTSNKVNEITNITESTGPTWVTPAFDAAGNTTTMPQVSDPTQSFTSVYDAWNRMVSISDTSGTVAIHAYDGRNRRIVKTTATETRHFYFTNTWQDVEERTGTSTAMDKQYVWGIRYVDELVCRDDATSQRLYACQDANFNLTAIIDIAGNVQQRFIYDPYANCILMTGSWSPTTDIYLWSVRWQGLYQESESGLENSRARLMTPTLGRFLQREPFEELYIDGMNLYEYLKSNPTYYVDPYGWAAAGGGCCNAEMQQMLNALQQAMNAYTAFISAQNSWILTTAALRATGVAASGSSAVAVSAANSGVWAQVALSGSTTALTYSSMSARPIAMAISGTSLAVAGAAAKGATAASATANAAQLAIKASLLASANAGQKMNAAEQAFDQASMNFGSALTAWINCLIQLLDPINLGGQTVGRIEEISMSHFRIDWERVPYITVFVILLLAMWELYTVPSWITEPPTMKRPFNMYIYERFLGTSDNVTWLVYLPLTCAFFFGLGVMECWLVRRWKRKHSIHK